MLRIVSDQHDQGFAIALHGKLSGEWVAVLERYWSHLVEAGPSARVTVTLADVSYIDSNGERLLERMCREGVDIRAVGCLNRYVIDRIKARAAAGVKGGAEASHGAPRGGEHRETR